jgi:hypothetical protein
MRSLHANEAVTKTEAKPPMPLTKGAPEMYQLWAPRYLCSVFPPQLTAIPRMMKI